MALQSPTMTVMQKAAEIAGQKLARDFGEVEHLQVSRKGPADFVSAADIRSEKTLIRELQKARPNFGFMLEEHDDIPGDGDNRWIIDPLDGTTNFLHAIPHFAISIAHEFKGEIVAGLVYNPLTDEAYWAEKGKGAYIHNRRLQVSSRKNLPDCILATGVPFHGRPGKERFLANLENIMDKVAGIRRFGSAALDMAYVAAGRYDAFWETDLSAWDLAAGLLLVKEARGQATTFSGKNEVLETGEILASNGMLHGPVTRLLSEAKKNMKAAQK